MNMIFSKRLKELRKESKRTQDNVARVIGIGRTTYSEYERGGIAPPADKIFRLAELFDVPVDYLVGTSNDRSTNGKKTPDVLHHLGLFVAWMEDSDHPRTINGEDLDERESMVMAAAIRGVIEIGKELKRRG